MINNRKIRHDFLFIFLMLTYTINGVIPIYAQDDKSNNILYLAEIPDSIAIMLDSWYNQQNDREQSVGAGWNVHKLGVLSDNTQFTNGVYNFNGPGPHFPWFMFIYYNKRIHIFKHRIDKDVLLSNILSDFIEAQVELGIESAEGVSFLKIILDWLYVNLYDMDWKTNENLEAE